MRIAQRKDIGCLKSLSDENIGKDYYSTEYLLNAIDSEDKKIYVCTDENDEPIAFMYMLVTNFARACEILKISEPIPGWEDIDEESPTGICKTTCTDKNYRGRGIFSNFVKQVEDDLSAQNIKLLMGDAIRYPSGLVPIANSVEKIGFRAVLTIPHPWSDVDSYCPYCKKQFCQCDAILYTKELN